MARTKNSIILEGVRGKIGDIVVKQYRYGTVITKYPDMSKVKATPLQRKKRQRFKQAVAYAKKIIANPKKKAAYKARLRRGKTVYHTAISEFLNKKEHD